MNITTKEKVTAIHIELTVEEATELLNELQNNDGESEIGNKIANTLDDVL